MNTYHSCTSHKYRAPKTLVVTTTTREKIKTALGETKPHCDTHQVYSEEQTGAQPHDYDYEKRAISRRGRTTVCAAPGSYLRHKARRWNEQTVEWVRRRSLRSVPQGE